MLQDPKRKIYQLVTLFVALFYLTVAEGKGFSGNNLQNVFETNPKSILAQIKSNYEGLQSLRIEMNYRLFKDYSSNEVYQEYDSEFCKNETGSYRKIGDTELVSNEDFALKINHSQKAIFVGETSEVSAFDTDLETTLKYCSDVKLEQLEGSQQITMIIKKGTDLPYNMIQIEVDNKYWIKKIKLFYSIQIDFSESFFEKELHYPRLEIDYKVFKSKWKDKNNVLNTEKYLIKESKGFKPAEELSQYKIVDYLIQN